MDIMQFIFGLSVDLLRMASSFFNIITWSPPIPGLENLSILNVVTDPNTWLIVLSLVVVKKTVPVV